MQLTPDFDPSKTVKSLLRRSRQGALATLMTGSGDPYCSLVNVASHPDGSPILLISRLALHTKNLLADARVSLMLDERVEGDPLEGSRIMLAGHAERKSPPTATSCVGVISTPTPRRKFSWTSRTFHSSEFVPPEPIWWPASDGFGSETGAVFDGYFGRERRFWKPNKVRLSI